MLLALAPILLDERLSDLRTPETKALMIHLGRICSGKIGQPDAGTWEIRDSWREHSFTQLMSRAGLGRWSAIGRASRSSSK